MEIIVPDQIIMGLILYAGDAKQHIYKALDYIKNGTCERCEEEIQLADAALLEAHNLQTKFLAQEASGTKTEITALFVHSQDHLMTSMTEINLIKEIISLRKELHIILVPVLAAVIVYGAIATGFMQPFSGVTLPWSTPAILSGFLVGGWQGVVTQLLVLVISTVVYFPFFKIQDRLAYQNEIKQS
ncbi:sugar phosphotransferase system (PTS),lactose/cellobiose-specific family, IIA component [Streptococcus pneumoniae BHN191]|nr:sugar phosphotransferase system (PTS),lactose/cellobiose-specific family, IIA component [Streptococcus pneumoniae BHN191]